jgi:H/ACA ribonucleoprotein complex subunit 4
MLDFERSIVFVDKPPAMSSHQVSEIVKRLLKQNKAGHLGTLDPNVTGLLIVTLNKATKVFSFLKQQKEYIAIMHLHTDVEEERLTEAFKKFTGKIIQIPPKRSAVKRVAREKEIYKLSLIEKDGKDVLFDVECEAGTYIRKLCSDIGEYLNVGAHLVELRRIKQGKITIDKAVKLQEVEDASYFYFNDGKEDMLSRILHPVEEIVDLKKLVLKKDAVQKLKNGLQVKKWWIENCDNFDKNEIVALFSEGKLVGFGRTLFKKEEITNLDNSKQIVKTLRVL